MKYPESFEIIKEFYNPKTGEKYNIGRILRLSTTDGIYFSSTTPTDLFSYTLSFSFINFLGSDYFREVNVKKVELTTTDIVYEYLYNRGLFDGLGSIQRENIKNGLRSIIEA